HLHLMIASRFLHVEAGLEVEDGFAMLDRNDSPRGEAATIADPVDLVQDGHEWIARTQEVGVQRVDLPAGVVDRASRGHQSVACYLDAEHPLATRVGGAPTEDVDLDRCEVEQLHERV